jgi:hypothetical protein
MSLNARRGPERTSPLLSGVVMEKVPVAPTQVLSTTGGAVTMTADQALGGLLILDCQDAQTITLPTAQKIVQAIPGCEKGTSFQLDIVNKGDSEATVALGSGITLASSSGTLTIPASSVRRLRFWVTTIVPYGDLGDAVSVASMQDLANTSGYLTRTGTVLSPATAGDSVSIGGTLEVSGAGPHTIGGNASNSIQLYIQGSFAGQYGTAIAPSITVPAGQNFYGILDVGGTILKSAGTHPYVTGANFEAPIIGGTGTIVDAATVTIQGAPAATVTGSLYALKVAAGASMFGGAIIGTLATYADDAAAGTGGLVAGTLYKTATGEVRVKL